MKLPYWLKWLSTELNKVSYMRLSVKIALISYWNDFSLIPLGNLEVCFWEESYEYMQKIDNFESALYLTSRSMPFALSKICLERLCVTKAEQK